MCTQTTLNRLREIVQAMPEESAREVLDFAEFLQTRRGQDETTYLLSEPTKRPALAGSGGEYSRWQAYYRAGIAAG